MLFAHDTEISLAATAALVNTGRGGTEGLPDEAALDRFITEWRWTGQRTRDRAELDAVRQLRPRLARLWELSEDDAAALVNSLLREAARCRSWSSTTAGTITCTPRPPTPRWPTGSR